MHCAPPPPLLRKDKPFPAELGQGTLVPIPVEGIENDQKANRFNFVFVGHNFASDDGSPSRLWLSHERAIELAGEIIGGGEGPRGFLDRAPFDAHRADFQFWYWEPDDDVVLPRGSSGFCSDAGPIDHRIAPVEEALNRQGLKNRVFMNLLNTDCRAQGTWLSIAGIGDLRAWFQANQAAFFDAEKFWGDLLLETTGRVLTEPVYVGQTVLEAIDFGKLLARLMQPFASPRTYLPLPETAVRGEPLTPSQVTTLGGHETGHAFHLWDLYAEGGGEVSKMAALIRTLNQDHDLLDLLGLRERLEMVARGMDGGLKVPPVRVNLLEAMVRLPQVTETFGQPLGFPHCAMNPAEGRSWAAALGVEDSTGSFQERGCLYLAGPPFYRSSDSIMLRSASEAAGFDPIETAWIEWQIECALRPVSPLCDHPPWM